MQNATTFLYVIGAMLLVAALSLAITGAVVGTDALPIVSAIVGSALLLSAVRLSRP